MDKFINLKIDNSKAAAIRNAKWKDPGVKMYDQLLNSTYLPSNSPDDPGRLHFRDYLKEAYGVGPIEDLEASPYGTTPYVRSGCKYPHHSIVRNGDSNSGKLVVNITGLQAAYSRAKQQNAFHGKLKEHLMKHYKELGLYDNSTMAIEEKIETNFDGISLYLNESFGINLNMSNELPINHTLIDESIQNEFNKMEVFLHEADDSNNTDTDIEDSEEDWDNDIDEDQEDVGESEKEESIIEDPPELLDTDMSDDKSDEIVPENIDDGSNVESTIKKTTSLPKQIDGVEKDKNGVRRKNLYIEFIAWAKNYNFRNTFGNTFDKDVFNITYPFIPNEMRYFYRLANPILCVLAGQLTFFSYSELTKLNTGNNNMDKFIIFAATTNDLRVFNKENGRIYIAIDNNGEIVLGQELGLTFDTYLQNMINKGDILNTPLEEKDEPKDSGNNTSDDTISQ